MGPDVEMIGKGGHAAGPIGLQLLKSGFAVNSLRTNDVLRKEEWLLFDQTVVNVARQRLVAVADLMNAGLRMDITNGMGTTMVQWETQSHMEGANVDMSGVAPGQRDRVEWALNSVPLPIVHKDFEINVRALEASRRMGQTLDTTQAAQATRLVVEQIENMVFAGYSLTFGGSTIYGFTNAPNRNTGSLSGDWSDTVNVSGEDIVQDIIAMIGVAYQDNMYGPYGLYVPVSYYNRMADDYKANSDRTILERAQAIPGLSFIRPSSNVSAEVTLVQLTEDVVDMINGLQPVAVMWPTNGGMTVNFKVMAIMVPRVKSDYNNQSGIVHYSQ